jgi:hypothetical protein
MPRVDLTVNKAPSTCRSCGAYGTSQRRPTCNPGCMFKLGRMRRARRGSRLSAVALSHARTQAALTQRA